MRSEYYIIFLFITINGFQTYIPSLADMAMTLILAQLALAPNLLTFQRFLFQGTVMLKGLEFVSDGLWPRDWSSTSEDPGTWVWVDMQFW